jgi:hypothetical protein
MADPIIFISYFRLKPGKLEEFSRLYCDSLPRTEASKPGTTVQLGYIDKDGSECLVVRLFPDATAMDEQLRGSDERSKATFQFIEPLRVEIFGSPSSYSLEMIRKVSGQSIEISVFPGYLGGFLRVKPS